MATFRMHVLEGAHLLRKMIYLEVSAARERVGVCPVEVGPRRCRCASARYSLGRLNICLLVDKVSDKMWGCIFGLHIYQISDLSTPKRRLSSTLSNNHTIASQCDFSSIIWIVTSGHCDASIVIRSYILPTPLHLIRSINREWDR